MGRGRAEFAPEENSMENLRNPAGVAKWGKGFEVPGQA
jgi:hypothetical protein